MNDFGRDDFPELHNHCFLGAGHEKNERKTWAVIVLCSTMMLVEIVGGHFFGSLALVADGLHMSTHAGAMLIAALAYTYARRHAGDPRFVFGTGKLGDLAGFTSAIVLAIIAVLIAFKAITRFMAPVAIRFTEAIPIAAVGLAVNIASAWLLSGHDHDHGHSHDHDHVHHRDHAHGHDAHAPGVAAQRDNNIRSAYVHVIADTGVALLAIIGLVLARAFGWVWMDPLAGMIGAAVILSWSYRLLRDTGGILLDMNPDHAMTDRLRETIEQEGDRLVDFHLWRLGPGHLCAVVSIVTSGGRDPVFYRSKLSGFKTLSHVTVEVIDAGSLPHGT